MERQSEVRHELVGGRVYTMAGRSERHGLAAQLLYEALAAGARQKGCRPFVANRLVRTSSGAAYYPDVMVICGPAVDVYHEEDPTLVIEVLSPSTEDIDRREKAIAYALGPSLMQYLLVDPSRRRIEVARPSSSGLAWEAFGPGNVIVTDYAVIDVAAFYDQLDSIATTPAG